MPRNSDDDKTSESGSSILGAILSIPIGLFGCFLSLAVPGLVIFALVNGPGNTWRAIQQWIPGSASEQSAALMDECSQVELWASATDDRMQSMQSQMDEFARKGQAGTLTAQDRESYIKSIEDLAVAQARSLPPPSVQQFNDLSVEMYERTASALRKMASGAPGWSADYDAVTAIWPTVEAGPVDVFSRCNLPLAQ
jgi:hypothetical protein